MPSTQVRRADRQGSQEEARALLETAEVGYMAVTLEDGHPYVVPLNYVLVGDTILIHSAPAGQKVTALKNDDRVCFLVSRFIELVPGSIPCEYGAKFESTIVFGKASFLTGEDKIRALEAIAGKYTGMTGPFRPGDAEKVSVISIKIESMTHKRRR